MRTLLLVVFWFSVVVCVFLLLYSCNTKNQEERDVYIDYIESDRDLQLRSLDLIEETSGIDQDETRKEVDKVYDQMLEDYKAKHND